MGGELMCTEVANRLTEAGHAYARGDLLHALYMTQGALVAAVNPMCDAGIVSADDADNIYKQILTIVAMINADKAEISASVGCNDDH